MKKGSFTKPDMRWRKKYLQYGYVTILDAIVVKTNIIFMFRVKKYKDQYNQSMYTWHVLENKISEIHATNDLKYGHITTQRKCC